MLKVLQSYYDATGDDRVLEVMTNYFRYQLATLPDKPLGHWTLWAESRGGENQASIYWLYNRTGEAFLLDLAPLVFDPSTGVQTFETDADGNRTLGVIGNAQPDFSYGFTASLTYKDVDFSFFIRGEKGRDLLNNTALEYTSKFLANTNVNFLEEALNDPTPFADSAPVFSSRWVQDASFLRVENVTSATPS